MRSAGKWPTGFTARGGDLDYRFGRDSNRILCERDAQVDTDIVNLNSRFHFLISTLSDNYKNYNLFVLFVSRDGIPSRSTGALLKVQDILAKELEIGQDVP